MDTRTRLLDTAERLYAEHGLASVSNRQVAEAAGQANNSAVAYHVGTKADLVHALCERRMSAVAATTAEMVAASRASTDARDHVASVVAPYLRVLAGLEHPSAAARFMAQVYADPDYGERSVWNEELSATIEEGSGRMWAQAPPLSLDVLALRMQMMRIVIVHTCAEREAVAAAEDDPVDWRMVEEALVDAVTGMLLASMSPAPRRVAPPAEHPVGPARMHP